MTATAQPTSHTRSAGDADRRRRIEQLARTEVLLLWRFNVVAATVVVTGLWIALLVLTPAGVRTALAPAVLLTDVTALGFLFVPALLVLERMEGAAAALRLTPARPAERIGVRVGLTTGLSVLAAAAVCFAAGLADVPTRLVGVALLSVLFGVLAFALTGTAETLTAFLVRAPIVAVPLIAPALLHLTGAVHAWALYLSPVTAAVDLLRGHWHWAAAGWLLLWTAGVAALTDRMARHPAAAGATVRSASATGAARSPWPAANGSFTRAGAVRSLMRADRRSLLGDGILLLLLASVPLLTVVMRVIATAGVDWVRARYGFALTPYLPLVEVLLLVVHTPVVLGSMTGLLLLEDRDAGVLRTLAVTRAGVSTLLVYRLGATAAATTALLAVGLPLDGVPHAAGAAGVLATAVAAGAVSAVPALLMAAVASNRVHGIAVMKMLGLPLYLPLATWVVAGPARYAFAPLPTSWVAWASWAPTGTQAFAMAAGAIIITAALSVPLARRVPR